MKNKPTLKTQTQLDKELSDLRKFLEGENKDYQQNIDLDSLKLEVASFTRLMLKKYMSRLIKLGEKLEQLEDELLENSNFSDFIDKVEFYNSLISSYNAIFSNLKSLVPVLKELSKLSNSVELRVVETNEDSSLLTEVELNQQTRQALQEVLSTLFSEIEM